MRPSSFRQFVLALTRVNTSSPMRLFLVTGWGISVSCLAVATCGSAFAQNCPPGSPGPPLVEWVTRVSPPPSTKKLLKKEFGRVPRNVTINVPVITVCGLWTFSKFSYSGTEPVTHQCRNTASENCCPREEVGLTPPQCPNSESENPSGTRCCFGLDPVQLLIYGESSGRTYKRMKNEHNSPDYRDHRDYDDFFACPNVIEEALSLSCVLPFRLPKPSIGPFPGCENIVSRICKFFDKNKQWVLMRTEGTPKWKWRRHVRGLQKDEDTCTLEHRDHLRMYGASPRHREFGPWLVGTPHHEVPATDGCALDHDVDNWISSRNLFAGSWIESGQPNDKPGQDLSVQWWTRTSFGLPDSWRGKELDGKGFIIGVDFDAPPPPTLPCDIPCPGHSSICYTRDVRCENGGCQRCGDYNPVSQVPGSLITPIECASNDCAGGWSCFVGQTCAETPSATPLCTDVPGPFSGCCCPAGIDQICRAPAPCPL